jgi:hypothetical protein
MLETMDVFVDVEQVQGQKGDDVEHIHTMNKDGDVSFSSLQLFCCTVYIFPTNMHHSPQLPA